MQYRCAQLVTPCMHRHEILRSTKPGKTNTGVGKHSTNIEMHLSENGKVELEMVGEGGEWFVVAYQISEQRS